MSAHRANRLEQARLDALEGRDQPSEVHPYKGPQSAGAFAEVLEHPTGNEPADPSAPRPRRGPPRAEIQNIAARGPSALEDLSAEAMRFKLGTRRHAASVRAALRAWHLFASTVLMYPVDSTLPPQTGAHVEAFTALFRSGEVLSLEHGRTTPAVRRTLQGLRAKRLRPP